MARFFRRMAVLLAVLLLVVLPLSAQAHVRFEPGAPVYPILLENGTYDLGAPAPFTLSSFAPSASDQEIVQLDGGLLEMWFGRVSVCDAFIVRCNGETVMIDGGMFSTGKATKAMLDKLGVRGVDYMFNTHHHDDHLQMQTFLLSHGFYAGRFLTPYEPNYPAETQRAMELVVRAKHIPYQVIHDGESMYLGGENGARIDFFRWNSSTNANYSSVMCKITYGQRSIFLMADVIGQAQKQLAVERLDIPWKADILKAGHHGYSKQDPALLQMIAPQLCIVTNTKLGAQATLSQMQKLNIPVALTTQGTIYLHTDGVGEWHYTQDKSYLER